MIVLGVDTSSDVCSVCLLKDNSILKELTLNNGKTHSENLVPLLKELLDTCGITFKDIDLIAVDKGPGSFTGIRIGIATIKAIAEVHNIKVVGVTSLQSLAFNEIAQAKTLPIISLIDARNNQVYCGAFNNCSQSEDVYLADDITQILEKIKSYVSENTIFIGNGSVLHKDLIQNFFGFNVIFSNKNEQSSVSTAIAGLELYKNNIFDTADTILPFYLRKSQAERMKEINNNGNNK